MRTSRIDDRKFRKVTVFTSNMERVGTSEASTNLLLSLCALLPPAALCLFVSSYLFLGTATALSVLIGTTKSTAKPIYTDPVGSR